MAKRKFNKEIQQEEQQSLADAVLTPSMEEQPEEVRNNKPINPFLTTLKFAQDVAELLSQDNQIWDLDANVSLGGIDGLVIIMHKPNFFTVASFKNAAGYNFRKLGINSTLKEKPVVFTINTQRCGFINMQAATENPYETINNVQQLISKRNAERGWDLWSHQIVYFISLMK